MTPPKYPIGRQDFESLRNEGCLYVDKTRYVYEMVHSGSRVFFLSRPRRFGKSLLLSTIKAYFEGKKQLFAGLDIYNLEKDWSVYPIFHIDLSAAEGDRAEKLFDFLNNRLNEFELEYGVEVNEKVKALSDRFGMLIKNVAHKCGMPVVILIDEYDKGILDVVDDETELMRNQKLLQPFFAQIKSYEKHIRFCLITGVARFRHFTIFSGFNNPYDISMTVDFAGVCGITKKEMVENFDFGIKDVAQAHGMTYKETLEALRLKYDGYRFSRGEELVFNPFSVLNCFKNQELANYWVKSGTSKTLLKYLEQSDFDLTEIEDLWTTPESMEGTYSVDNPVPLLFQTGYLTIKDSNSGFYKLGIPNGEVRSALVEELIPKYMGINKNRLPVKLICLKKFILAGDINGFLKEVQAMISAIPFHILDLQNIEKTYHLIVYQIFLLLGVDTRSEISIAGGRVDMVAATSKFVYVMEFKLGGTVDEALKQIDDREYAIPWSADGRKVYKVGIVFSPNTRTIEDWKIG